MARYDPNYGDDEPVGPKCRRCGSRASDVVLDRRVIYPITEVRDGVLVLGEGDDTGVSWAPRINCTSCGHSWPTRRPYEES